VICGSLCTFLEISLAILTFHHLRKNLELPIFRAGLLKRFPRFDMLYVDLEVSISKPVSFGRLLQQVAGIYEPLV